jgi:ethanolaminephosphotransferase
MYCILWAVQFIFMVSHWEKYNTGTLYLPWGYDFSMVGAVVLYLITAIGGHHMWKIKFPGDVDPGTVVECTFYAGVIGLAFPIALYNIWKSYRDETGKMRTFLEANRPLVPVTLAIIISFVWVVNSKNKILEADVSCFFYMSGTTFANICVKLIIAQMSNTRSEILSAALFPLTFATALSLIFSPSKTGELAILYILTGVLTVMLVHYGSCVVSEMCDHFHVRPFHIKKPVEYQMTGNGEDLDRLLVDNGDIP